MNADGKPMDLPNCKPEEAEFIPVITNEGVQYLQKSVSDEENKCIGVTTRYLCNPGLNPKCVHSCGCFLGPNAKGAVCYCTTDEQYAYKDIYGKLVRVSALFPNDDELLQYSMFFRTVYLREKRKNHILPKGILGDGFPCREPGDHIMKGENE